MNPESNPASELGRSTPRNIEYVEYEAPKDTTFEVPVDFVLSSLVERDIENHTWKFRKGSGSALVSYFTIPNGRPIPFVSAVERSSRPCPIGSSSSRSYMYKVVRCAHRNVKGSATRPCRARATLKFSILSDEDSVRAGNSYRPVQVIWDRLENNTPIPCVHVKGAVAKGVVRKAERMRLVETSTMPSHMTLDSIDSSTGALAQLLTGNRTGLLISQGAAQKARSRGRKELYERDGDTWLDLRRVQYESWDTHCKGGFTDIPIASKLKSFLGSVHDLQATDDGGFCRLTLFTAVSYEIHRRLLETGSDNAKIVLMDSTQFRESEVMVSVTSDYVLRSLSRGANLRYTPDKRHVWVKPLHTFLVIRLDTGTQRNRPIQPYVCAEHISIDRTTGEMVRFLETYFRRLEFYIGVKAYPTFFVSDEDKAFTAAATWVFNRMYVSEYGAVMLLASKRKDEAIRFESVRTVLVHCSVHKSRNLRDFIHDLAKDRKEKKDGEVYSSLNRFLQQLLAFLRSASSYEELCYRTGVVFHVLSSVNYPYVSPGDKGRAHTVVSPNKCFETGEKELWKGLTPTNKPPSPTKPVHRVRLESRLGKEQLNWDLEVQLRKEVEEESGEDNSSANQSTYDAEQEISLQSCASIGTREGTCALSYGRFNAYVRFDSMVTVEGVDRLLVNFHCPFLSGFGYGDGGFKMLCKLSEVVENRISSPLWAEGRCLQFFQNSVFANSVFLCDAITGRPPLTHNTSVEVAIKNRTHVDEIGLEMKTCAKGMSLPEYVTRRSQWIDKKNIVQLSLMSNCRMSARRRGSASAHNERVVRNRKKFRLTDIARSCDVDARNVCLSQNLFRTSLDLKKCSEGDEDLEKNDSRFIEENVAHPDIVPSTQLSLSEEHHTESVWRSTRGVPKSLKKSTEGEADMRISRFLSASTEKLRDILSPFGLSGQFLSSLKTHIHSRLPNTSSIEEIGNILNAVLGFDCNFFLESSRQVTLNLFFSLLESSTVWDEGRVMNSSGRCDLLPFVQRRIARIKDGEHLQRIATDEEEDETRNMHDAVLEDMRVLVAPKWSCAQDSRLTPRIVNRVIGLYSELVTTERRNVLIQTSNWLEKLINRGRSVSKLMRANDLEFLSKHTKSCLPFARLRNWYDTDQLLCPLMVNKNKKISEVDLPFCIQEFTSYRSV